MKRVTSLILLLVFSNLAVAHTFASGGGTESSSEETDLTIIILAVVVAGVATLIVSDILSDDEEGEYITLTAEEAELLNEETGVNWEDLAGSDEEETLPLLAVSVFPGENGRDFSNYFSSLLTQGDQIYYTIYPAPVSFGSMEPSEAAETGFSFLDCQWFVAADSTGIELFSNGSETLEWQFLTENWDSTAVREASSSFLEFAGDSGN